MSNLTDIKMGLSKLEALEKELNLKRLQINSLLTITQAINDNVSADELYEMYHSFLSWELTIKKMALFVKSDDGNWHCASSINIAKNLLAKDISPILAEIKGPNNLDDKKHPLISQFDVVIPVAHKKYPIAYVFIGGFSDEEDMYNKVQLITTITNVIAVAIENKRLFKQEIEKKEYEKELELASKVQGMLIPKKLPKNNLYEFDGIYVPYKGIGGDYYDYIPINANQFLLCIADVSGKGIPAAIMMSNLQASLRTLLRQTSNLTEIVEALNFQIMENSKGDQFITFFGAIYDHTLNTLVYVNSGHNPPFMVDGKGEFKALTEGSTVLGAFEELPFVNEGFIDDLEGFTLLAYTDGLTETENPQGVELGSEPIEKYFEENFNKPLEKIHEDVLKIVDDFRGSKPYRDDITLLSCKVETR